VASLAGVAQSPPHHEEVLAHTLTVLRYLAGVVVLIDGERPESEWAAGVEPLLARYGKELRGHLARTTDGGFTERALLMWGGLLHDVGKRATQSIDADGRIRFIGHDEVGAEMTGPLLGRLAFSNEAGRRVRTIVDGHMRPLLLANDKRSPSARAVYRYFRALHQAGVSVGLLALADHLATYDGIGDRDHWAALLVVIDKLFDAYFRRYEQAVAPPRLLDGRAIMDILEQPPGQDIGRLLHQLEEAQATGRVTTRAEAEAFVRSAAHPQTGRRP
jgi:putative nucleotidyltransferase with HDIG domain